MSDEQTIVLTVKVLEENGFIKDPEGFYSNSMISFKKLCDILGCEAKDFHPCHVRVPRVVRMTILVTAFAVLLSFQSLLGRKKLRRLLPSQLL